MKNQNHRNFDFLRRFEKLFKGMLLGLFFYATFTSVVKAESFFVNPGAGLAFGFRIPDFSSSLGAGVEYSDGFSFFSSVGLIVSDSVNWNSSKLSHLTITLNAEYKLLSLKFTKPYVFVGPGLDIFGNFPGFGLQVGIGSEFELARGTNIFIEGKYLAASGGNDNGGYGYYYLPIVDLGLKLKL